MIRLDLLGPCQLWYGDQVLKLRPLDKQVHIALQAAGGTRSMTGLAEDMWQPARTSSLSTLRGCLSRARRAVEAAGGTADQLSRTIRQHGGQTMITTPGGWDVDADRFRTAAAAARTAYDAGRLSEAHGHAAGALKLWYHEPLPGAAGRPFAQRYIDTLCAVQWSVTLTKIKAAICLGWHHEILTELRELTTDRSGEGEIPVLYATALYRSDHPAEAAAVCQHAIAARHGRGIEASRLQQLQQAILSGQAPAAGPLDWLTASCRSSGRPRRLGGHPRRQVGSRGRAGTGRR